MPPASVPRLAAVVPATDSPATLDRCLQGLRRSTLTPDEIVVVSEPAGAGPAEARNAGAASCGAELLLFCDADVVVHPDAVERVASTFAADPGLDAVFGAYDDSPAAPGLVSRYRNLLHHHVHSASAGTASSFWAGLGAVRRASFERAGGFDAQRFPGPAVEDVELGMRMARAGARIRLDPTIRGTHLKHWTLGEMVRTDFARRGRPWARLQLEAGRIGTELNLGWRHRLGATASVAATAALALRRPRLALASAAGLAVIHLPFFGLLARRGGLGLAGAGVGLHALHHLTATAAALAAVGAHTRDRWGA